jgi:cardiolipin synthase
MKRAGCHIAFYHPFRLSNIGKLNNRDHRKIIVIDGRIAYVGGHCLVDSWLGDAQDKEHFRDISIRIEGPAVLQIQGAFCENWIEETGDVPGGSQYFPELEEAGEAKVHAVYVSPSGMPSTVKLMHYMAIEAACEQITIQNPYFLPDPEAREALVAAVKRGVDVRVMMPSAEASDSPIVQHASHHHFGTLLKGGIQIYEYEKTLLHQKVMTVDHCWSSVGSTNFDDRSFEVNDEISIGIYDRDLARQLEEIFDRDLRHCRRCTLDEWKRRSLVHKFKDFSLYLVNEQL